MLGVARLVEERVPVVRAAHRLDDQHDAPPEPRSARRTPGALLGPRLEVELDVLLGAEVDAEPVERPLERRHHAVGREALVPLAPAEGAEDVVAARVLEGDAGAPAEEAVEGGDVQRLRLVEEGARLRGELLQREAEALVQLAVGRRAERARALAPLPVVRDPARHEALLGELDPGRLEPLPPAAVGLVGDRRPQHPVRDLLAVHGGGEGGLEPGDRFGLLAREVAEVALAGEVPELDLARATHLRRAPRAPARRLASSGRRSARRWARARSSPSGPRSGGSTPRPAPR